ncbi:MAG: metal-dependent hydrolase [Pseudomonadota bacterium]
MDNLTHTLIGAVVAEAAARIIPVTRSVLPASTRRNLYMTLMIVGSNLPDADLVYTSFTGGTLSYLLDHRGHTHTLVIAIVLAALMYFASSAWLRWRHVPSTSTDRYWLAFIAVLAPLLHIGMDATNEYGVHPFWPFNNAWFYGDAIFIVEPLFWVAAAPLLLLLRGWLTRGLMAIALLLAVGLSFGTGLVPLSMAICLALLCAGLLLVAWRASARTAAVSAVVACVVIVAMFLFTSRLAYRQVTALAAAQFPDSILVDEVLAPLPVNPLCWEVILMQVNDDDYTLRQAMFALAPGLFDADRCSTFSLSGTTTVALSPTTAPDTAKLQWQNEVTMSLTELQALVQNNCEAAAFTQFGRALWIQRQGEGWIIGDLRYDREPELGFAELALPATPTQCPSNLPPWIPPRIDVLER